MTQRKKQRPMNPRQAAASQRPIDGLLRPELFKALGDPTRLLLTSCLAKCRRPCLVSEVAECCSVDLSVVSRHLSHLERAGILRSSRSGRTVAYSVRHADLCGTLRALADAIEECCPGDCCAPGGKEGCCG